MRRPIQIAIYVYRMQSYGREYLLLRRTPESGGFWQGVTGGVEDDETVLETATRELREETGFAGTHIKEMATQRKFPVPDSMRRHYDTSVQFLTEYAFHTQVESDVEPALDSREHTEFKWVSFETALEMLHFPGNIESLKECERELSA